MPAAATAMKVKSKFPQLKDVRAAMEAKLEESALAGTTAKKLKFQPLTASEVASQLSELPVHRAGFTIPYFDLDGKPTDFYRFRYLEYGEADNGFAALTGSNGKQLRYGQPKATLNQLYLPPLIDWRLCSVHAQTQLIITEGELKAACATKHKLPTIGLGGVWCFKSTKETLPLLPQFQEFKWQQRRVYICYDSDAVTNHMVVQAENALARELTMLGAIPYIVRLPALKEDAKTGLDDFIVARGVDALEQVFAQACPFEQAKELYQLNEEVLYVREPGVVLRIDNYQRLTPRAFVDHAFATRIYWETKVTANGETMVEKSAPKEWIKWPNRREVAKVTYAPGKPLVHEGCLNVWRGWAVQPVPGDIAPWHGLLDFIFANGSGKPEHRRWFTQWLAYPLQHPGEKLYSAVVVWGIHHGTGKSLMGYTMQRIYGDNATEIGDRDLYSNHNEWAENKQFVMGDEITGGDKRNTADRMKSMITQKQLRLNPKYVPSYTVPDCINYYFTSNHPDAFFLEDTDRRFFIHEIEGQPMDPSVYQRYMRWLNKENGAEHLFHHLLNVDCSDFLPQGHAPVTASKQEMIDTGRSDVASWVASLREDADRILKVGEKAVQYKMFTSSELHLYFDPQGVKRVTVNVLIREIRIASFKRQNHGMGVRTQIAGQQKLWAVRDVDKLMKLKPNEIGKFYDDERNNIVKSKSKF